MLFWTTNQPNPDPDTEQTTEVAERPKTVIGKENAEEKAERELETAYRHLASAAKSHDLPSMLAAFHSDRGAERRAAALHFMDNPVLAIQVVDELERAMEGSDPVLLYYPCYSSLKRLKKSPKPNLTKMAAAITQTNNPYRESAINFARFLKEPAILGPALATVMTNESFSPRERFKALDALNGFGADARDYLPSVLQAALVNYARMASYAFDTCKNVHGDRTPSYLIGYAKDRSHSDKSRAGAALALRYLLNEHLSREAVLSCLLAFLVDANENKLVRSAAAEAFGVNRFKFDQQRSTIALPAFMELVADADENVRKRVWRGMSSLGSAAVPFLVQKLQEGDSESYEFSCWTLQFMGTDSDPAIPHLVKQLSSRSAKRRNAAIETLFRIKSKAAVKALKQAANDPDEHTASAARLTLERISRGW